MQTKYYLITLIVSAFIISGCVPKKMYVKGGHIDNISQLKPTEQLLVGSVEIIPAITESERDLSRIGSKQFIDAQKQIFWLVRGDKWLDTKKYDVYANSGGMSMDFSNHTPIPFNNRPFYITSAKGSPLRISGGYIPTGTQKVVHTSATMQSGTGMMQHRYQTEFTPVATHLPFKLKANTDNTSQAIYIGDIKVYRDKSMKVTKVVVKDNYTQANSAYKATFKVKADLKKSLATR